MNPATLQTIILIEQLVGVVAQGIGKLKAALTGAPSADTSLADADATYQAVIDEANRILALHPAPLPGPPPVQPPPSV